MWTPAYPDKLRPNKPEKCITFHSLFLFSVQSVLQRDALWHSSHEWLTFSQIYLTVVRNQSCHRLNHVLPGMVMVIPFSVAPWFHSFMLLPAVGFKVWQTCTFLFRNLILLIKTQSIAISWVQLRNKTNKRLFILSVYSIKPMIQRSMNHI